MAYQARRKLSSAMPRDGNHIAAFWDIWSYVEKVAPTAFVGGTSNARGDKDGTNAAFKLFNVTGDVKLAIIGVCTVTLVGAATIKVGTAKSTAGLIAQIADATDLAVNEIWHDATPDTNIEAVSVAAERFLVNGADIIETVATADITAGNIYYLVGWYPLSFDGKVEAAV